MIPFPIAKHIMPPGALDMTLISPAIRKEVQKSARRHWKSRKGQQAFDFYELHDNKDLPPSEKSIGRLENEETAFVIAGKDSTAKSIAITHFYLLCHLEIMERVRSELQDVPETASWSELKQLPYLSGCIAEGNPLSFGVAARTARISPNEALQYKQYTIPHGTPVSETTLSVHTDETIFPDPWEFQPER